MPASRKPITELLLQWRAGNAEALDRLMELVYGELRRLARRYMNSERYGHTLQSTALVHEAYLRLVDMDVPWQDRIHFFSVASRLMRRILVDHAKRRRRVKRGAGEKHLTLEDAVCVTSAPRPGLLDLDDALNRLEALDPRKVQLVDLHYFGGLTYDEAAQATGFSPATVHRELRLAKAWLYHELRD